MSSNYLVDRARQAISRACSTLEGEDYEKRQAFRTLMPQVSQLRSNGHSFQEIAALLTDSGLKLSVSDVRTYYSEFNCHRMQELVEEMDQYLQVLGAKR